MTIGANIAIMAAAAAQRNQRILDAFRVAGATTPERAASLADLGLSRDEALVACEQAGVVRPGSRPDHYWLDEAAYVARRHRKPARAVKYVVFAALLAIMLLLLGILLATREVAM